MLSRDSECVGDRRQALAKDDKGAQDQFVVLRRLDLAQNLGNPPVGIDDERRALVPKILATVELLRDPNPIGLRNRVIFIGEQREVQSLLVVEFLDLRDRIGEIPRTTAPACS